METDSDYVGCVLTRKSTTCWTQGMRSLSDAESGLPAAVEGRSTLLGAKNMRKGVFNTADISTKAVTAELLRRHLETSKMGCGDRRIPPTFRAMPWLRRMEWRPRIWKLRF